MKKPAIDALAKVGDLPLGFTAKPGSTIAFKTGDWRSVRPVLDREKCIYCGFCYYYCPDGVYEDMGKDEKYYKADLDYCKGCGICAHECPKKAITMTLEEV
ncbi:MAG: 4Fe-4S binding protein [Deltaproteobacteria bacterium]|jgi:pyruvate ferredoxin oxidoreductase delta subunit|nr:4Fe-4S binding protein [Deltaproteobacteria bacterium]